MFSKQISFLSLQSKAFWVFLMISVLAACGGGKTQGLSDSPSALYVATKTISAKDEGKPQSVTTAFEQTSITVLENLGLVSADAKALGVLNSTPVRSLHDAATPTVAPTTCPYLMSGQYKVIAVTGGPTLERFSTIKFDASTLTGTNPDGARFAWKTVHNSPCKFLPADSLRDQAIVVASSGMLFAVNAELSPSTYALSIGVPEVPSSLKELAGTYVYTSFERATPTAILTSKQGIVTFDRNGELTAQDCAVGTSSCAAAQRVTRMAQHPSGYFYDTESLAQNKSGLLMYHIPAANGAANFLMVLPGNEGVVFGTRQTASLLPQVGRVQSIWETSVNPSGLATTLTFGGALATISVDSGANSFTRRRTTDGRTDTFTINNPLTGLSYRPPTISTLNTGATTTLSNIVAMPMREAGFFVGSRVTATPSNGFMFFSIDKLSRFSNVNFREIYKFNDPTGSFNSIGSTTVGTNDLLTVEGAIHRITDSNSTGSINVYPQGTATAFTSVIAAFNSRMLTLCNNVPGQSPTKSTHILVPDSLVPVTSISEVGTRTLVGREDCQVASQTVTFNLDGSALFTDSGGAQTVSALDVAALFSPTGRTQIDSVTGNTFKTQLKLYKAAAPNPAGPPFIFFVMVEIGRGVTNPNDGYLVFWSQ